MILTAGYNVYPAELEQVIAMHPAVSMDAVAGRPDEEKGEVAEAFIVLHRNARIDEAELVSHCRQHLASYKVPRGNHFVNDVPKTRPGNNMGGELFTNQVSAESRAKRERVKDE